MDHKQVLQARANRHTRLGRPFEVFYQTGQQCIEAGNSILSGSVAPQITPLLERSVVVSLVTGIEVYYKDMVDLVFRFCRPSFFEPALKGIHPDKYDITDLVAVYRHSIHPLELVTHGLSFQNVERIEKVFSGFLGTGIWTRVLGMQVRLKEDPTNVASWSGADLAALKRVFALRHELVHDPARRTFLDETVLRDLGASISLVFGTDLVLTEMIMKNKDPELPDPSGPQE